MVEHIYLYNPAYFKTKELVQEIGPIRYITFERCNNKPLREDISVLWDWGDHGISLCLDIMQEEPREVVVWAVNKLRPKTHLFDMVWLNLRFNNETSVFIKLGWLAAVRRVNLTIVVSESTVVLRRRPKKR